MICKMNLAPFATQSTESWIICTGITFCPSLTWWNSTLDPAWAMGDIEKMKRYPFSIHHYSSLCHRHVNLQYELDTNLQESQLYLQFYNFIRQASNVMRSVRVNVLWQQRVRSICIDTALVSSPNISEVDSPCCVLLLLNVKTLCWPLRESIISY